MALPLSSSRRCSSLLPCLPPCLPRTSGSLGLQKPPEASREQWKGPKFEWQLWQWLRSAGNTIPTLSPKVPTIVECIRRNLGSIHTASARQCLDSLLLRLTNMMPWREVKNLLQFSPPRDSTDLAMWEVILAMPKTLKRVLSIMMEDLPLRNWCTAVTKDTCIRRLAMLAQNHISEEDFGNPVHLQSYLKHPSPMMRFLVLKGLCTVSESPVKVSGPSSSKAMLAAWGFALLPSRPSPLPGSKAGGWCSGTRALCPGWSLTASRKGNGVFPTGKGNSGPAARHPGGSAGHQHRRGAEGPACAEKRDGSCGEVEGQWPGSAAG
eukprot:XP_027303381.1 uncharacterized protein LOC113840829 [Anas platyrhynchos]